MRVSQTAALAMMALLAASALAGCRCQRVSAENDRLRAEVLALTDQVSALTQANRELVFELHMSSDAPDSLPEDVRRAVPHVTDITIGRYSGPEDDDGDGVPESLLVYVKPLDGRGRFVQLVGDLTIRAVLGHETAESRDIGFVTLDPTALRDAHCSGFMGTHYRVTVPLDVSLLSLRRLELPCALFVTFDDALTGRAHTIVGTVGLRP